MNEKQRFGEILVRAAVLDRATLDKVLAELGDKPVDLGEVLVARRLVDEAAMLQAVGKALNLPSVGLDQARPDERALALVPRALCLRHRLIPIEVERSRTGEHLHVAMANPTDVQAIKAVTREARRRIRPLLAPARAIRAAIERFYGSETPSAEQAGSSADLFVDPAPSRPSRGPAPTVRESTPLPQVGRSPRRPSAIEMPSPPAPPPPPPPAQPLIPPDAGRAASNRATNVIRRGLDNDLMDALDHSAMGSVAGPDELALSGARPRGGDYGLVRRSRRQRSRGQVETGNLPPTPAGVTPGPLPALPPSLGSRRRRPERTTNRPEPRRRPGTSPPPARMPTSRHAGEVLELELEVEPPTPEGVIDDRETSDRLDVRRLLERMVSDPEEGESGSDHVLSDFLDRYGDGPSASGDKVFAALDRALGDARSGTARLLVVLIRHLARRGLVDLDELLDALAE